MTNKDTAAPTISFEKRLSERLLAQSAVFASETDGFIYPRHYSIEVGNVCAKREREKYWKSS